MDELMTDQQTAVGLAELELEGLINYRGEDAVELSNKGIDYAWALFHKHTPKDRLALTLLLERIRVAVGGLNEEDV